MNINGDVHFEGWPRADVKDFTEAPEPGFCVLRLVDTDRKAHQLFLKPEHLSKARLAAVAINGDLAELHRLLAIPAAAPMRAAIAHGSILASTRPRFFEILAT